MSNSAEKRLLFERLFSEYYPMVVQMCKGYMKGDDDLAKDLSQDVFVNVWNALSSFKGEALHKTWIYRITVNTCLLHIRNNRNKQTAPLESVVRFPSIDNPEQDTTTYTDLYKAIGELPELDRLIMMLLLEELEYDDICQITGISPVNLRVKIHRIKRRMKETLEQEL